MRNAGGPRPGEGRHEPPRPSRYAILIWHGFFLAFTKAALDLNTVFPALISRSSSRR